MSFKKTLLGFLIFCSIFTFSKPAIAAKSLKLSELKSKLILEKNKDFLVEKVFQNVTGSQIGLKKIASIILTQRALSQDQINYMIKDYPWELSKRTALICLKSGYSLLNSSVPKILLDSFEDLSVSAAKNIAEKKLTKHKIKARAGEIKLDYKSLHARQDEAELEYILFYKLKKNNIAEVSLGIFSPHPTSPPFSQGYSRWRQSSWKTKERIPPFVIKITGKLKQKTLKTHYVWQEKPKIKVSFPEKVPEINLEYKFSPLSVVTEPFKWMKNKITTVFSSEPTKSENKEIEKLKESVVSLKESIQKEENTSTKKVFEQSYLEGLQMVTENLNEITEQNKQISKEIAKIVEYQVKISELQTSNTPRKETSNFNTSSESSTSSLFCSLLSLNNPQHKILFNEIAWMGNNKSSHNEWMELKNNSSHDINLKNWQIINKDHSIEIKLPKIDLLSNKFYLLERTDDNTIPDKKADLIYQGSLNNQNETLFLFNNDCVLQDIVIAQPDWPAGSNKTKQTMERKANLSWQTSTFQEGTPLSTNSTPNLKNDKNATNNTKNTPNQEIEEENIDNENPIAKIKAPQKVAFEEKIVLDARNSSDNKGITTYRWDITGDDKWNIISNDQSINNTVTLENGFSNYGTHVINLEVVDESGNTDQDSIEIKIFDKRKILITEIQIEGDSAKEDFIELYNPSSQDINLANYQLRRRTSGKTENLIFRFNFSHVIKSGEHFLWSSKLDDQYPQRINSSVSSKKYLAANNSVALINPFNEIVDQVAWGKNHQNPYAEQMVFSQNPSAHKTIGRIFKNSYQDHNVNEEDFTIQNPSPGDKNFIQTNEDSSSSSSSPESTLLISEIQKKDSEFIELYNPTEKNIPFCTSTDSNKNCYVLAMFSSQDNWNTPRFQWSFPSNQYVSPKQHYLIQLSGPQSSISPHWRLSSEDGEFFLDNILSDIHSLGVFKNKIKKDEPVSEIKKNKIDLVAWSKEKALNLPVLEESKKVINTSTKNLTRKYNWTSKNYQDTNNNSNDFLIAASSLNNFPTAAPKQVVDLTVNKNDSEHNNVVLNWSIPDDVDSSSDQISYKIRYRKDQKITEDNWNDKKTINVSRTPHFAPNNRMSVTIPNLYYNNDYYFCIKAFDQDGNLSSLSNNASFTTPKNTSLINNDFAGPKKKKEIINIIPVKSEMHWNKNNNYYPPVVDENGTIYFTGKTNDYNKENYNQNIEGKGVYALNSQNKIKWFVEASGAKGKPVIGKDGSVYFLYDNGVGAISPRGELKWKLNKYTGDYHNKKIIVDENDNLYIITGKKSSEIILHNISNKGVENWSHKIKNPNRYINFYLNQKQNINIGYDDKIVEINQDGQKIKETDISSLIKEKVNLINFKLVNEQIFFLAKNSATTSKYFLGSTNPFKYIEFSKRIFFKKVDQKGNIYYLTKRESGYGNKHSYLYKRNLSNNNIWKSPDLGPVGESEVLIDKNQKLYFSQSYNYWSKLKMFSPATQFNEASPKWTYEFNSPELEIALGNNNLFIIKEEHFCKTKNP